MREEREKKPVIHPWKEKKPFNLLKLGGGGEGGGGAKKVGKKGFLSLTKLLGGGRCQKKGKKSTSAEGRKTGALSTKERRGT